jgi:DNA polymerase-3 subunit epsilon
MTWADQPIHFIDFEGNATSGIIEFGVVTLRGGEITATQTRFCAAVGRVSVEDTAVHGLRAEQIAASAIFREEWAYFSGLRRSGPLAAHFAQAENYLLKTVWAYPQTVPDFARPGQMTTEWGPWIDTGRLYPQFFPALGDGKLQELVVAGGLQAELDALAQRLGGALLLRSFLARPEFREATIPWLLQMSTLDGDKRSALQQGNLW